VAFLERQKRWGEKHIESCKRSLETIRRMRIPADKLQLAQVAGHEGNVLIDLQETPNGVGHLNKVSKVAEFLNRKLPQEDLPNSREFINKSRICKNPRGLNPLS
jgi:hypothetical protein